MNLSFTYEAAPRGSRFSPAVEAAHKKRRATSFAQLCGNHDGKVIESPGAKRRDDIELKIARIANGKEPGYANGGRCANK
jgi:hypothetical protein